MTAPLAFLLIIPRLFIYFAFAIGAWLLTFVGANDGSSSHRA
jgi:hypothetical protein